MKIEIINNSSHPLPAYATAGASGMDLRANVDECVTLGPWERVLVGTGLHVALPQGYEGQVRTRSGLALKHGLTVLNSPGTIDADYRGEIKVILMNLSPQPYSIENGDRIAQFIVSRYSRIVWTPVSVLGTTIRGEGGFGSTGKKSLS